MRCTLLLATAAHALQPPTPHTRLQPRAATMNASEDPLQTLQTNVDAIWSLPGTGPANVRSRMTRERKEATHATLWGKKEWDQQIAYKHGPHRRYARVLARSIYSP